MNGVLTTRITAGPSRAVTAEKLLPHVREFADALTAEWRAENWMPEVAHGHLWTGGLVAVTAARHVGVPMVQSFHEVAARGDGDEPLSRSRRAFERPLGSSADLVVAFSKYEESELVGIGLSRERIDVVAPGVDTRLFRPRGPAVPQNSDRPRILAVGDLLDRHGFSDLVLAMRYVPEAELVIMDSSPYTQLSRDSSKRALRDLSMRFGSSDRLQLLGPMPRHLMPRWYRSADVFVAAPWHGRYDRFVVEAMACGVPVIGTAVAGINEAVINGITGDLVMTRAPRSLAAAVRGLLVDRGRWLSYAAAAADRGQHALSWNRSADQISAVYRSLVSRSDLYSLADKQA